MNRSSRLVAGQIALGFCTGLFGALTGCTSARPDPPRAYVSPPPVEASVPVGFPGVVIRVEGDFYEPLTPYGRWEVVGSYGRCWIPGRVEAGWRPYSEGYWQRTDVGWYWASDEPWGWATYHYGRWDWSSQFGWYWVPQTQWAPAWVSWHRSGAYIGWAPLYPSSRFGRGGSLQVDVRVISPRAYVFVEERHFLEPVRRSTVVVNNTTIINQTVNITKVKVVNNTVINEGPRPQTIEKASGRKPQAVPVRELRHQAEAEVVAKQRTPTATRERNVQPPLRNEAQSAEKKALATHDPAPVQKPAVTPQESAAPAPKKSKAQSETRKSVHGPVEAKPVATKESTNQKAKKPPVKQEQATQRSDSEKKAHQVSEPLTKKKAAAREKGASKVSKKEAKKKGKEPQPVNGSSNERN